MIPCTLERERDPVAHLTWTDLEPLLRRENWNERTAHPLFWGVNNRATQSPTTDRLHELARQACRYVYAKGARAKGVEEDDLYNGALVRLWDRSKGLRGLKAPAGEHRNPEAWMITVFRNAAWDVVEEARRGTDPVRKEDRRRARSVKRAEEAFYKLYGRKPSDEEIAEELAISDEDVRAWRDAGRQTTLSIAGMTQGDDDRPGFDPPVDDDIVERIDARTAYARLADRIRDDHRVSPFRRLALACLSYPDLVVPSLVHEAAQRSADGTGLLRSEAETLRLLTLWKELLPTLEGDASSGIVAWILRADVPLLAGWPSETPADRLRRSFEVWAAEHVKDAVRARDAVRSWQRWCKSDFGMKENDA